MFSTSMVLITYYGRYCDWANLFVNRFLRLLWHLENYKVRFFMKFGTVAYKGFRHPGA